MKHPLFLLILLLPACQKKTDAVQEKPEKVPLNQVVITKEQFQSAGLVLGGLVEKNLSAAVKATGVVDVPPQNMASVSAPLGGFVEFTSLLKGNYVRKGQTLAVLQNPEYIQLQEDYLKTLSQSRFLQQELTRQQTLDEEQVGARKNLQQAQAESQGAAARLQALAARLQQIGISPQRLQQGQISRTIAIPSPLDGYVTAVNVNTGKYVNPTDVMFEIMNQQTLHAELQVFEKDIFKIKPEQEVVFRLNTLPGREFRAKVHLVGKSFENDTKTINIHCDVQGDKTGLLPGMFINANILTGSQLVGTLPDEALIREGELTYVFLQKSDSNAYTFEKIQVKTGILENGFTEVSFLESYTKPTVVTQGAYFLQGVMKNKGEE
jgi:membrane fusion protein, heavy metal efflux system